MFSQTLSVPPHFPHCFAEGAVTSRRGLCANGKPFVTDPSTGQPVCLCQLHPGGILPLSAAHGTGPGAHNSPTLSSVSVHLPPFTATRTSGSHPDHLAGTVLGKDHLSTRSIPIGGPYSAAALAAYHPYLYAGYEAAGVRKAAVRETTGPLKSWLYEHRKNPYPTKAEKIMLAIITQMTLTQVSTWFANARRRLKKESRGNWDGCLDREDLSNEDKDETQVDTKDADCRLADQYENLSDVSVDDEEDAKLKETASATENRMRYTRPQQSALFHSPAPQAPRLPRLDVPSGSMRLHQNGNDVSTTATPKPKIWSISTIIGLDDRNSDNDACKKSASAFKTVTKAIQHLKANSDTDQVDIDLQAGSSLSGSSTSDNS